MHAKIRKSSRIRQATWLLTTLSLAATGCPATQALPDQASILQMTEPRTSRPYLLYVPSTHTGKRPYPLLVACHGTWPWDTADRQMREWAKFGEYEGILIAAPRLVSAEGAMPPPPEKQITLQHQDESAVLSMVSQIKRTYNIEESQVFLTGWSAGAYPLLHIGLRNPEVFRALFVRQGNFDSRFMDVPNDRISKWQPIKITYGKGDPLRDHSMDAIDWLQDSGAWVDQEEIPGIHRRTDPKDTWRYFRQIIKERPWIRILARAVDPARPLSIRCQVDGAPRIIDQKWFFGDGNESRDRSPRHTYKEAGIYTIRVNVELEGEGAFYRTRVIRIGRPE